jgi:hypothetical protein
VFIIYRKRPVISPSLFRSSTMEIQLALGNVFHILFYRPTPSHVADTSGQRTRLSSLVIYGDRYEGYVRGKERPLDDKICFWTAFVTCIIKTACPWGHALDGNSHPFTLPSLIRKVYRSPLYHIRTHTFMPAYEKSYYSVRVNERGRDTHTHIHMHVYTHTRIHLRVYIHICILHAHTTDRITSFYSLWHRSNTPVGIISLLTISHFNQHFHHQFQKVFTLSAWIYFPFILY